MTVLKHNALWAMARRLAMAGLVAACVCGASLPVRADIFMKPNTENLFKALLRFGALNIRNDDVVDEYAKQIECKIYQKFYTDDFTWQRVRAGIREAIKKDIASYPIGFYYDAELQLDRFDFKEKIYRFKAKATIRNVNSFAFYERENYPCAGSQTILPAVSRVILDTPVYVDGLPLHESDGKALLARMESNDNADRIVYTRFNIRIVYVAPMQRMGDRSTYVSTRSGDADGAAVLDGRLDSIDFYEDPDRTRLIYTYRENLGGQ